ncbi:ExbD/TolR family protein [Sulfuriflexus mobilis]|uniref:ExbD/TolR family protein n=1 Tax=Sulfuriflexus mobilis TaxID=1811807 RepID=UPI000F83C16E|nr:biopolymer transporter ExbD [Sulfuriflexus mobilis]
MRLRQQVSEDPDVNLTPLIDVVFLLLIFFMVSTTFNKESELSIDLPTATGEVAKERSVQIEISIDAEGHYAVNNEQLVNEQLATLKNAIIKVAGDDREQPLVISADGRASHQSVVTAMNAARQLGFSHLTFATKIAPEEN